MPNNTNNTNSKTLEFISLIKCILEYYATTKKIDYNDGEESVGELFKTLKSLETENLMSIDLPEQMNKTIESAFISHIKFFEEQLKNNN
jgi:hypothetical protein